MESQLNQPSLGKDEPLLLTLSSPKHKKHISVFDARELRLSSHARENSVAEIEKMMMRNQCMHQEYRPSLVTEQSINYLRYIQDSNDSPDRISASIIKQSFLQVKQPTRN